MKSATDGKVKKKQRAKKSEAVRKHYYASGTPGLMEQILNSSLTARPTLKALLQLAEEIVRIQRKKGTLTEFACGYTVDGRLCGIWGESLEPPDDLPYAGMSVMHRVLSAEDLDLEEDVQECTVEVWADNWFQISSSSPGDKLDTLANNLDVARYRDPVTKRFLSAKAAARRRGTKRK